MQNDWRCRDDMATAEAYRRANGFLTRLRGYESRLTKQEYTALKGEALKGNLEAAEKGLAHVLAKKGVYYAR